jgi:hypothetical protein
MTSNAQKYRMNFLRRKTHRIATDAAREFTRQPGLAYIAAPKPFSDEAHANQAIGGT